MITSSPGPTPSPSAWPAARRFRTTRRRHGRYPSIEAAACSNAATSSPRRNFPDAMTAPLRSVARRAVAHAAPRDRASEHPASRPVLPVGALTIARARVFCGTMVEPNWTDRTRCMALMAAVADRRRAAALPEDDRIVDLARRHRLSPLSRHRPGSLPPGAGGDLRRDRLDRRAQPDFSQAAEECVRALAAEGIPPSCSKATPTSRRYIRERARGRRRTSTSWSRQGAAPRFGVLDRMGFNPRPPRRALTTPTTMRWRGPAPDIEVDLHLGAGASRPLRHRLWRGVGRGRAVPPGCHGTRALRADHAAVFHALRMAIDLSAYPAIYRRLCAVASDSP